MEATSLFWGKEDLRHMKILRSSTLLEGISENLAIPGITNIFFLTALVIPLTSGLFFATFSIYGPQDNEPCVCKDLLPRVSRDEEERTPASSQPEFPITLSSSNVDGSQATCDNSENEEDNEPNSEEQSESTVISAHKISLKSIESSTDTLVAEHGFPADNKFPTSNGESKLDAITTPPPTERMNSHGQDGRPSNVIVEKNHSEFRNGDMLSDDIQISLLNDNLSSLAVEPVPCQLLLEEVPAEKLNGEDIEELSNYTGIENLPGHHCTVCEQSKAVLRHVQNHDSFHINGSGNPSSSSSGIGTSSYASEFISKF